MKTGKYSLRDLLTHNEIDQMVIPELQRDYVWTTDEVSKVWNSFIAKFKAISKNSFSVLNNDIPVDNSSVVAYLEKTYDILVHKTKMGFVYAYHDKEMPGKFFLIDGQQRMTTFYLILLAIYVKLQETDKFRKNYYYNGHPKIDYKVRESAYEFLRLFLDDILKNNDFKENKNFFKSDYTYDTTVRNLIDNYQFILLKLEEVADKKELLDLLDYVENYIEFNYFDTNLSEQGESLYLYMNSRGFHLSHQEKLRANLIEKEPKEKKKNAGKLWEDWQDFFFEYKYDNENADTGFEEFLYFSSLLKKQLLGKLSANDLNNFENLKDFQINHLDIAFLNSAFTSLKAILFWQTAEPRYIHEFFKDAKNVKKQLYRYLPVWYNHLKFSLLDKKIAEHDLHMFSLFILNNSHTRDVTDDPDKTFLGILNFVDGLHSPSLETAQISKYFNQHDADKIMLMSSNKLFTDLIFTLSFDYKFQEFLEGRSDILFKLSDVSLDAHFDSDKVQQTIRLLKNIFIPNESVSLEQNLKSKVLRRYILSYFDFRGWSGWSNYGEKYNLIKDNRGWLSRVVDHEDFKRVLIEWKGGSVEENLEGRRTLFKDEFDWRYYFIHYDNVLNHSQNHHFIYDDYIADIILIQKERQTNGDCYLAVKVLQNFGIINSNFRQHELQTAYIDLVLGDSEVKVTTEIIPRLTVDLVYQTKGRWCAEVFYKDVEDDSPLHVLENEGFVKHEDGKWKMMDFYSHSDHSLKENLIVLKDKVQALVTDLNNKGLVLVKN